MTILDNRIRRKGVSILLISALITTGLFSCQNVAYADRFVLSEQTYYHLDMGVQIAYNAGCDWGSENIYNSSTPISVNTTITFNTEIEVLDTYPLSSSKGSSFDFKGDTSSHNIPSNLGAGDSAYDIFYVNFVSASMTEGSCSSSGNNVSFNYTARLNTSEPLEVVSYGEDGKDYAIYQLFGGKTALENDQPEIADAIETALNAGANGTAGTNKLYLIFCPNVIEYKKYITIGDLEARLKLPSSAKQGESYTASDDSIIDSSLTVESAVLEKHDGDGDWEEVAAWDGSGLPGKNTGGSVNESCDAIGTITYRMTVNATNGQVDTDTKTIQITDSRQVEGQAILVLPAYTYEGHPVLAEDVSVFSVDGVNYSARRAYEEDVAENKFIPLPTASGTAHKESLTTANVVFPRRGNYQVKLEVDTISGNTLTDTKPIEVRKTPYIIDSLGGFQKQNRKQILDIAVATYPGKPIIDYSIKLKDLKTGEEITLTKDQPEENSTAIKTRKHTTAGDQYWTEYHLEFLTKTPEYDPDHPNATQNFRYTIYMKDSKGDTDTLQKTFTVAPDLPPNAQITIQDSFIRNKGTNIAEIEVGDSSTTDGDQLQRIWTVRGANIETLPGFQDRSFGSRQRVKYNKTGVGKEDIDLYVKDVWTEPTLEEYVTASDHKSSSTSAITDVINIAPTVRLEPIETEEADVAILTTKASQSGIEAGMNNIRAALIEAGIDANLQIIPTAAPNNGGYRMTANIEWPVTINCGTCQSTGLVYDSECAYRVVGAARTVSGYQEVCTNPHTIYAMNADGNTAWSYTVNEFGSFRVALDQQEKYLYIISSADNKTVMLNRKNGAYLTTLNIALPGGQIILQDERIYILTGSNIQRYDLETATLNIAAAVGGSLGRLMNGKITFVMQENPYKYSIASFDPVNETTTFQSIPQLSEYLWTTGSSGVSPTDMDTTGKVTFTQTLSDSSYDTVGIVLWLADAQNYRVYNMGRVMNTQDARANSVGFVKDETGKAVYLYHGIGDDDSTSSTTRHYYYLDLYTLGDEENSPIPRRIYGAKNNSINYFGSVSYAQYHSDENTIYLMMGNAWQGYDWGGRLGGLMYKIKLPGWSVDSNYYNWGWDAADEYGTYGDSLSATYYSYDNWTGMSNRVKLFKHSITEEQAKDSAINRFANLREGIIHIIEDRFTSAENLIEKIKYAFDNREVMKITSSASGLPTSMMRTFHLTPGNTYYYEYELKDAAETTGSAFDVVAPEIIFDKESVYGGEANLGTLTATKIIYEDFNDSALDPFFTFVDGSINGGLTTPGTTKGSKNRDIGMSATVKFTIPEGKKAIAVFDVRGELGGPSSQYGQQDTNGWKSGVYINGQRYDKQPKIGFDVSNYVHPYLLIEGENTIQSYCCWYGRGTDGYYISVDNLRIIFLEDSSSASDTNYSVSEKDGWKKVAGTFTIPIGSYKAQTLEQYDWPPGLATSGNGNDTYYDFTIPAGKTGKVFATFSGYTYREDSTAGTLSMIGWSVVHRGTRNNGSTLPYVNSSETYFAGNYQGSVRFTATAGYQRSVGFSQLKTYVFPDNLAGKTDFFFDGSKVYSPAEVFSGKVSVQIQFPADSESFMRNLKIYYMKDGKKIYMQNENLNETADLDNWNIDSSLAVSMAAVPKAAKQEEAPLVYKKGQLVSYNIFYDDYENDPSKKQYWRYTHTPMNDGPNPQAAFILDEEGNVISSTGAILAQSIPRFYIDGKYTVEHWQEDNTNRTGDTSGITDYSKYDKPSNIESLTFYIEGGASAPWITSIKTIPSAIKEGGSYRLQIGVDDTEKDELRLTTELYKDKKVIYTHRQTGIVADSSGIYPLITTGLAPTAVPGKYEVVCTVRDWSGAGIGSYKFTVVSEGKITGFVNHTDLWDDNRKKYNLKRFSEEVNRPMQLSDYLEMPTPRKRGTNIFWSGEKFMLQSETEGKPWKVDVQILTVNELGNRKSAGYSTELSNTGKKTTSGAELWEGGLWEKGMINKWGRKNPEQLIFIFTAYYASGMTKVNEVFIIVDSRQDYWQLHRLW